MMIEECVDIPIFVIFTSTFSLDAEQMRHHATYRLPNTFPPHKIQKLNHEFKKLSLTPYSLYTPPQELPVSELTILLLNYNRQINLPKREKQK